MCSAWRFCVSLCHQCLAVLHPRLLLVALARLAVGCRLQAGGKVFLCPAPGQVLGGLRTGSRLSHGEGVWSHGGFSPKKIQSKNIAL